VAERPDLDYVLPILGRELAGQRITAVTVKKPVVVRVAVPGTLAEHLAGRTVTAVTRRGHFARFALDHPADSPDLELVVAPMLAGRFVLATATDKRPADLAVALELADGRELRYRDDVQMGKVYLIARGDEAAVPGLADIGVDVLDPAAFTLDALRALVRGRRDQVKVFLMDKRALDALGNAYADEVLFAAGIHPKTFVRALGDDDLVRLHRAIPEVLRAASDAIARARPPLDVKLRDFVAVRGRHKQPCPRCGTAIRKAGVRGHDAYFCPRCQPESRRSSIVDWRKAP
jgi:formamidopyrimidine-DNA glycosylase